MAATRLYVSRVRSICPSLGGSPRSVGGSDSSFFQMTNSAPGLTAYEILCLPFDSEVPISHSPPTIQKEGKLHILGAYLLGAEPQS